MGKLAGFGSPRVSMIRRGLCVTHDPEAILPSFFSVEVKPEIYEEFWGQGISIYHNPNAIHPLDPDLFPNVTHHFYEDGQIRSFSRHKFNPLMSQTIIFIDK
jgi:hypothetical protein